MADPESNVSFESLNLTPELLQAIAKLGWKAPTPVQAESIPAILAGRDVVVQSRTGTGKTGAFGIPIMERIDLKRFGPQALVLCPTRELALQVANELAALGRDRGVRVFPIYGGANMRKQIDELERGLHVVVGTPGRLLDHLRSRHMSLAAVRFLVLDEADEMLSMGFYEEVSKILDQVPKERETMLFSATVPPGVEGLIYRHQREPLRLTLSSDNVLVAEVHHAFYVTPSMEKARNLALILLHEEPTSAIIFVNTRHEARQVTGYLQAEGFDSEMLSGELSQADRERVMGRIKANQLRFMVATDVAARGIDITNLSHVVNFSVPENREVYVHRTGRTGRIGRSGTAITLVGLRELPKWGDIEKIKGLTLEERKLPTSEEILEKQVDRLVAAVRHMEAPPPPPVEGVELPAPVELEEKYRLAAERIMEQGVTARALAGLLSKAYRPVPEEEEEDGEGSPTAGPRRPSPSPSFAEADSSPPPPRRPRRSSGGGSGGNRRRR